MNGDVYPFVVARNRMLDWRPLVAPAPLVETAEDYALVLETGTARHPAPLTIRRWCDQTGTPWLLAFRSIPADARILDLDGEQLTDRFGRSLYLVEGIAVRDAHDAPEPEIAAELVERVHPQAVAAFRDFWSVEDEGTGARGAHPLVGPTSGRAQDGSGQVMGSPREPADPGELQRGDPEQPAPGS